MNTNSLTLSINYLVHNQISWFLESLFKVDLFKFRSDKFYTLHLVKDQFLKQIAVKEAHGEALIDSFNNFIFSSM